jgi:hypothetical protein
LPTTLTRYVAPGCNLIWDIKNFVEKDTYTNECSQQTQYDDDTKQGRLRKTGGTVAGDWSQTFTTDGPVTYTVPAGAEAGQTITIALEAHDTRQQGDARHDDWGTYATWNFVVRTDCPASLTVDALTDVTGQVPAGCTKGVWDATMKANGDPPPGRTNWNGTTLTETLGPLTCNDTTEFVQGMNG